MDDKERYEKGMQVRRAVLGDAYVDAAVARVDDFTREFQDYIVRFAWGDPWQRPGLDRKMRSVTVISITLALGHWDEFRLHLRGAINNGLTKDEIKEILMHCAAYAGVPAANHAFREAQQVFREMGI